MENRHPTAKQLVAEMDCRGQLPALDSNVGTLCGLTKDETSHMAELAAVIMRDASLTTNILALANSAAYRSQEPIKTVTSALIHLGMQKVQTMALGLSVFQYASKQAKDRELFRLFTCSYYAGTVARSIARKTKCGDPEEMFVAGVLHQLPKLVLANAFPDRYRQMEQIVKDHDGDLELSCRQVFGVGYSDLKHALADHLRLPEEIKKAVPPEGGSKTAGHHAVEMASDVADLLFGNRPAGAKAMKTVEHRFRNILGDKELGLSGFLGEVAEDDPGLLRFFNLGRKDVEMMVGIAEWGRVSSSQIAAGLSEGSGLQPLSNAVPQDPMALMGTYLTELTTAIRLSKDLNNVLLVAHEAVYRCLQPDCVFTAFLSPDSRKLVGRLYAGRNTLLAPSDFVVAVSDEKAPAIECLRSMTTLRHDGPKPPAVPHRSPLWSLGLKHSLIVPIVVRNRGIGIYYVGRCNSPTFSSENQTWVETIAWNVGMAFIQS